MRTPEEWRDKFRHYHETKYPHLYQLLAEYRELWGAFKAQSTSFDENGRTICAQKAEITQLKADIALHVGLIRNRTVVLNEKPEEKR